MPETEPARRGNAASRMLALLLLAVCALAAFTLLVETISAASGITVSKNANSSAPTGGTLAVSVTAGTAVTITNIYDHYEVHYTGDKKPAACNLPAGTTGGSGWYRLTSGYSIHFTGSPALNDASPGGSSQNAVLARGSTTTWNYNTVGQITVPPECVSGDLNTMLNYIDVVTNMGDTAARSVSYPPSMFTSMATATPVPTVTPAATNTPVPPTATLTPVSPTATATNVPGATATPSAPTPTAASTGTAAPAATSTPVVATATATSAPPASATPVPPSATATVAPASTATPVPPTSTPTLVPAATNTPVSTSGYALDGQFGDWSGAMNIADQCGDGSAGGDNHYFNWGTNPNDTTLYFMIERCADSATSQGASANYTIFLDMNNNGQYTDSLDRLVQISYTPRQNNSGVQITVRRADGTQVASYSGDWGESTRDGALRVEAKAAFADLGMISQQTIRMYVSSSGNDRTPDSGDVQYSPIPVLGYPLLGIVMAGAIGLIWWRKGRFMWRQQLALAPPSVDPPP